MGKVALERRIVALVLPNLVSELAVPHGPPDLASKNARKKAAPFGVVIVDEESSSVDLSTRPTARLDAVNAVAYRLGVRAGQTIAEARAFVARLVVHEVPRERIRSFLGQVAEVALAFGTVASTEVPDTVWLDITGAAHLAGGESELLQEISARVRALGHTVRTAVAGGPRIAQAFARWAPSRAGRDAIWSVPSVGAAKHLAELPVNALPVDSERISWLVRLGVHTLGDLGALPRAAAASRLGEQASRVLDLTEGIDDEPLVAYEPVLVPTEQVGWEDPVSGSEPLLFALRGLTSRLSARLEGRGEAAQVLELSIEHDRSIAKLRGVPPETTLRFELSSPLYREEDLRRIVTTRLQRLELGAPSLSVSLRAVSIARALRLQLDLSRSALGGQNAKGPEALPIVLGELSADIGNDRFGVLEVPSSHLPERRSKLVPVPEAELLATLGASRKRKVAAKTRPERRGAPNRLLPRPIPLEAALRVGVSLSIEHRLYTIEKIAFEHRLESVEWWTSHPASRDYLRLWLKGAESGLEAIVYVNRETGTRFLQALCD